MSASTATGTKFSLIVLTADSVQYAGPRHARAEFQVGAHGAPPLPDQTNIGFPSDAAICRAIHRLVCHGTSIQRDSPGCGLISFSVWAYFSLSTLFAHASGRAVDSTGCC